jgi:hypothetical protein
MTAARHDKAVDQGLFAHLDSLEGQRLDAHVGIDDQRLLVHERDTALLAVQLAMERLAHLRQKNIAIDKPDRPIFFSHGEACHVAA